MFLQLSLAMAAVVTVNRSISFLDIFFAHLPASIQTNQVFVRVMYGFLDISFLPFAYFFLITAFSIDLLLNFALHYRSARHLHKWYIPASLGMAFVVAMPILAWDGKLGASNLYIVEGNWAQQHYHIITLTMVIIICSIASLALVGAGFWRTIREWRILKREIDTLVLPISDSSAVAGRRGLLGSFAALPMDDTSHGDAAATSSRAAPTLSTACIGQILVYAYPGQKWAMSTRDFSNDSVGVLLLIVFVANPAFVQSKLRRQHAGAASIGSC
ncbi:hypothetical protein DL89DRAFT_320291 [Linderina pennispora]|uniref:Uncharacterized protein n=1 Tax=Linderina pennispora TaxID=61395 RepID=A0A1Y1WN27_9FUNG|nr:uncharacterized protein DL89DRAFT_320291 [Linderina pennispora]ORX74872.1 hypothetical protein DL89DRAFT_320291 [Linderina pennispora]